MQLRVLNGIINIINDSEKSHSEKQKAIYDRDALNRLKYLIESVDSTLNIAKQIFNGFPEVTDKVKKLLIEFSQVDFKTNQSESKFVNLYPFKI